MKFFRDGYVMSTNWAKKVEQWDRTSVTIGKLFKTNDGNLFIVFNDKLKTYWREGVSDLSKTDWLERYVPDEVIENNFEHLFEEL